MDKRKLIKVPVETATIDMLEQAQNLNERHLVTAHLIESGKILLLNFFEVAKLKKGKTEAAFRTFLSENDYITQDLSVSKVKWFTAAFDNMQNFRVFDYKWDGCKSQHIPLVFIWSANDKQMIEKFFETYSKKNDESVWSAIGRFQDKVKASRLEEKHRKVLTPIDLKMKPIVEPPQEFRDWVWEHGMSFSRYGIYKEISKGKAEFECTYCKKIGIVDRSKVRLRNNEKGECPFCGSKVTYKARGKMPYQIVDERWFIYVDRQEKGFLLRYFNAKRHIKNDASIEMSIFKERIEESLFEYSRCFWTFAGNTPMKESYEWGVYRQRGHSRWIPDEGNIACMESILYPGNLPQAWEQAIDGNHYELRLLQVAQKCGIQMKPEQLKEFYETFECNTTLLKQKDRKVSLHKLCKYIAKESERYPLGEKGGCWKYSYMRYKERTDPQIERKQNMAKDWLEYLGWCRELKYDLNNMFVYMPNNFKYVHDRTAKEYQALQDKKAAAEKRRKEAAVQKAMEQTRKAMEEIFMKNRGTSAFQIRGKGLILLVPQSGDEIRKEGEVLHHCVGSYVDRVARGETSIFFIRKSEEPNKPYFTMEWKNNDVVQCRGTRNCGMPPEVKAFVEVFKKKMLETIGCGKKQMENRRCG